MKRKASTKRSKRAAKVRPSKIVGTPARAKAAEVTNLPLASSMSMPPPELLMQEAEQEPDFRTLSAYADSIGVLRSKGFSYREIAEWLSERGIDVDHNAVYRVYTNSLSDHDAHLEDLREAEEAQHEARRNL
jgi:hypothetical protein